MIYTNRFRGFFDGFDPVVNNFIFRTPAGNRLANECIVKWNLIFEIKNLTGNVAAANIGANG